MRTWGRVTDPNTKQLVWVEVTTDADGNDAYVWATTLCQNLKLNLGESPFWANHGIPAQPTVVQQVFPDFYVALNQLRFSRFFASLIIARQNPPPGVNPQYKVNITTKQGVPLANTVAT